MSKSFSVILDKFDVKQALSKVRGGIDSLMGYRDPRITLKSVHTIRIEGSAKYKYTYVVKDQDKKGN